MTTYMCMCISLTEATTCKNDILIETVSTQSTINRELRMYPEEGHIPRASEAPFAPDIGCCSKSWTTVDAGRAEEVRRAVPWTVTRKKTSAAWTSSRGVVLQKPNRRTPHARFAGGRGFWRHLLSRCSMRAEVRGGENQWTTKMWYLSEAN
jgi:hypothetical protein